jgi:hypothetical protein
MKEAEEGIKRIIELANEGLRIKFKRFPVKVILNTREDIQFENNESYPWLLHRLIVTYMAQLASL